MPRHERTPSSTPTPALSMSRRGSLALAAAGVLAAVAGLSGCVVAPYPYRGYGGEGVYVDAPPPPPQAEVVPPPPVVGWLWIGGYWTWQLGRHVWIGGRWAAPRPGYEWYPHRWERDGRGWRSHGGYWGRR